MKTKKPTYADLARQNMELKAQLAYVYASASKDMQNVGAALMGGGVLVQMHALGGRELIKPVVIRDGLSDATIQAFKADLLRSYELATLQKPK